MGSENVRGIVIVARVNTELSVYGLVVMKVCAEGRGAGLV